MSGVDYPYQEYDDNYWEWAYQLEIETKRYLTEMEQYDENKRINYQYRKRIS